MQYLIYLRKSRADQEAELRGEGETLARHEKALLELARRQHLPIADIYREVVSGETIASRPMMQQLLLQYENMSALEKNSMLKEVLRCVKYERECSIRDGGTADNFTLYLYPKISHK